MALFFKTLLAPEFIAVEGLQEWAQCRRMEKDCSKISNGEFKLIHAYYISMLALRYNVPQGNRVIWPNQYVWLLQQRLIDWKDHSQWGLAVEQIRDKNKADSVAKLIALGQVLWFVATCIMRAAHALPLSQLESMTLSYIPLFAVTYFFWWEKPKDVRSPSIIDLPEMSCEQTRVFESMAVSKKFDDENNQLTYWNIWYLTPRVFEKEEEDRAIQHACMKAAEKAAQKTASQQVDSKSATFHAREISSMEGIQAEIQKETVLAHWDPYLYRSKITWLLCCFFGTSFGALHLASWNTTFPTHVEMWLWRASAFVSIFSLLVFMHFEKVVFRWDGLLSVVSLGSPGLYFISRILMMGEVFAALRAEDPAIYETYEVSSYWVHLL
ncbi:uncharacterized protein PMAA_052190 [Aspergillus udagawae]|uniref:Uncharacterized protein PMAA_052190 n=1 Tax=Aspergillus udagawae TaxID=91492 RepID=A0ABQ1BCA5_9EURO|nr:uncharacterized protein PMAA_052190 [Aspergillus udagawae]